MTERSVTQIVVASTLFAAVGAAAAIDEGALGTPARRLWLSVNNAVAPELTRAPHEILGAEAVAQRFHGVVTLTDVLAPTHPSQWSPREQDLPMLERLLRRCWGIGDGPIELVLESIAVNPARALARIFDSATIVVHSEGLMSYGPTRDPLPWRTSRRIERMLHLDLVPGLTPRLLTEHEVRSTAVPASALRKVFDDVARAAADVVPPVAPTAPSAQAPSTALLVGQYLAAIGVLTREQESHLHSDMVERAADHGARRIVFKPHPSAPPVVLEAMAQTAQEVGVELVVLDDDRPVEALLDSLRPDLIVGCFSTALVTANTVYDIPVLTVDTAVVLKQLVPMRNSNRVPIVLIDALFAPDRPRLALDELQRLVDSVAYSMQPENLAALRPQVAETLEAMSPSDVKRYHRMYRLRELDLPGVPLKPPTPPGQLLRRVYRRARRTLTNQRPRSA